MDTDLWNFYRWLDKQHFPPPSYQDCVTVHGRHIVDRALCEPIDVGLVLDTRNQVLRVEVHGYSDPHSFEVTPNEED